MGRKSQLDFKIGDPEIKMLKKWIETSGRSGHSEERIGKLEKETNRICSCEDLLLQIVFFLRQIKWG